jgi:uncharacterized membrane protein (UPF0127 family)
MKKIVMMAMLAAAAGTVAAQGVRFGSTQLAIGMYRIQAEVAANDPQRQQGLMYRDKMAPNAGMVFVFDQPNQQCMWMKNTLIPLSVAFVDADGAIVNIEDMQPQTHNSHCSKGQVLYALEMNLGWFKQRNIKAGTKIQGLPKPE